MIELGLFCLKTQGVTISGQTKMEWDKQLLLFTIQNIFEEVIKSLSPSITIRDKNENLVSIVTIKDIEEWKNIKTLVENAIENILDHIVIVYQSGFLEEIEQVSDAYEEIKKAMYSDSICLPIIKKVKAYAEKNYANPDLSIQKIADDVGISINHLSMLFKQEIGISFIEYLIKFRMSKAIRLMENPSVKVYEVAEQVGYNSQHYFCAAFKKVLGISPTEFRLRANKNK